MSWINTTEAELKIIQTDLKEIENPTLKNHKDLQTVNQFIEHTKLVNKKDLANVGFSLILEQGHVTGLWTIE